MFKKRFEYATETLPVLFMAGTMVAGILSGLSTNADATSVVPGPPWSITSSVTADVTDNQNGTWTYDFTVSNLSAFEYGGDLRTPIIVDWEIPYFDDAGVTSIQSPSFGWNKTVESIGLANPATGWGGSASWQNSSDPLYQGANSPFTLATQVLHWYVDPNQSPLLYGIWPTGAADKPGNAAYGSSLGGFSFTANFEPVAGPYQASWTFGPARSGDPPIPFGITPASPCATEWTAQCAQQGPEPVPEPGTLLLAGLGFGLLGLPRLRRRT